MGLGVMGMAYAHRSLRQALWERRFLGNGEGDTSSNTVGMLSIPDY